jgi:hypothetical protein
MAVHAERSTAVEARERASGRNPAADIRPPIVRPGRAANPANLLALQRLAGNRATVSVLREEAPTAEDAGAPLVVTEEYVADPGAPMPDTAPGEASARQASGPTGFVDLGMVGTAAFGDPDDPRHARCPHAFVDGGRTGTVAWAGGGGAGARGNEAAGSIQTQVPPTFTASAGPGAGLFSSAITAGTGRLGVTRSWLGVNSGAQGNGRWVSVAAAALINAHETRHVASTRGLYTTHLAPVETRIADPSLGRDAGATAAAAIAAHRTAIGWQPAITAFQAADIAANAPGGTIDAADIAAGWVKNIGAGTVSGVAYTHRTVTPTEGAPPP